MIKGIIFDMDGVVLDTEKLYLKYWLEAGRYYGYPVEEKHIFGIRSLESSLAAEKLKKEVCKDFDFYKVKQKRIELMNEDFIKNGVQTKYGIYELLSFLKEKNIRTAIATATPMDRVEPYLKYVGLYDKFDEIVSAYSVKRGKPFPDIYIEASRRLSLSPSECYAVEDSPNGVQSAYSAGCKTIMVPDLTQPDNATSKLLFACLPNLIEIIKLF